MRPEHKNIESVYRDAGLILFGTAGFTNEMINILIKQKYTNDTLKSSTILEAGCGSGKLGMYFCNFSMKYIGLDIDPDQREYCMRLKRIAEQITLRHFWATAVSGTVHDLKFPDNNFLFSFSEGVIEHWQGKTQQNIVNEMTRVSKDFVIIFVPNADHPDSQEIAKTCKHDYVGMEEKEYPMTKDQLKTVLEKAGLKNILTKDCSGKIADRMIFGVGYKQ